MTRAILLCVLAAAILYLIAGCENPVPRVAFLATNCREERTGKTREVRHQGMCLMRTKQGMCMAYAHSTVTEHEYIERCEDGRWR